MARYIDADKLIVDIKHLCWVSKAHEYDAIRCVKKQPTADVVPKSEVEELETEIEELQAKVARLRKENVELLISKETDIHISMEKLVKVRTEHPIFKAIEEKVAREIFEEIESKKIFIKDHAGNMGVVVMLKDIAELKKKYIGDAK